MGVHHSIMWRLVVFIVVISTTLVVILSSTTTGCFKKVQIDNELDSRVKVQILLSDSRIYPNVKFSIEKGSVWTMDDGVRRGIMLDNINATVMKDGKEERECDQYSSTGTGYWHFKVEYKNKEKGDGECQVNRIGGLS